MITDDIGIYSKDALNAALKTIFGEISPNLHDKLPAEANAVVSTIFNRFDGLQAARKAFTLAKQALPTLHKKGRNDFDRFAKMTGADQTRNLKRWQTAKSAVESLANDASKRVKYLEFRANHDAKGQLKPLVAGRTRIGGNDFF